MTKAEAIAGEEYRRAHVPLYNDHKLKLGVFGINCSYGLNISHAPTTYKVTWEHTSEIVKRADAMGFELALPVARWRGFGGTTDFNGESFETYTWAAGLAQATRNIMVAATSHVPTVHPIVAAKQAATIDHISNGRFALNLVEPFLQQVFVGVVLIGGDELDLHWQTSLDVLLMNSLRNVVPNGGSVNDSGTKGMIVVNV